MRKSFPQQVVPRKMEREGAEQESPSFRLLPGFSEGGGKSQSLSGLKGREPSSPHPTVSQLPGEDVNSLARLISAEEEGTVATEAEGQCSEESC